MFKNNKVRYVNHIGRVIEFNNGNGYLLDTTSLHDYAWSIQNKGKRIGGLDKGISGFVINASCYAGTNAEGIAKRNALHDVFERDVRLNIPGTLYIGEYYIKCFITASKKEDYSVSDRMMRFTLTVTTDNPNWIREVNYTFRIDADVIGEDGFDFPYDYAYDYMSRVSSRSVYNDSFIPNDVIITIYGNVKNPELSIGGFWYGATVELLTGEKLIINTKEKTVVKVNRIGEVINAFANRLQTNYPFEKLRTGTNAINSPNVSNFDITILDERSEPLWM